MATPILLINVQFGPDKQGQLDMTPFDISGDSLKARAWNHLKAHPFLQLRPQLGLSALKTTYSLRMSWGRVVLTTWWLAIKGEHLKRIRQKAYDLYDLAS